MIGGPYSVNANTLHETGHVHYGAHQYTDPPNDADFHGKGGGHDVHDDHDYNDLCIMGYQRCDEDFCGRCALNHAGWDTVGIKLNAPP